MTGARDGAEATPPDADVGSRRNGVVLFAALSLANASNYLFQVVASRFLGPSDYGLMGSLFAIITIIGVSTSALQTANAKFVAGARPTGTGSLWRDPLLRTILRAALVGAVLFLVLTPLVAEFFRGGIVPVGTIVTYLVAAPFLAVGLGRLQGMQAFRAFAAVSLAIAGGRLVLTVLALLAGLRVAGVILATAMVTGLGGWWSLRRTRTSSLVSFVGIWKETSRATVALVLFWLMVSVDVPLARHALSPETAGQYTAASVIGKAVLWLPGAISLMMFPKVAQIRLEGGRTHPLLLRALLPTLFLCSAAVVFLFVLGPTIIPLFFGRGFAEAATFAWKVGLACIPFAVANVLVFYHLTRASSVFVLALLGGLLLEVVALVVFGHSLEGIVTGLAVGSTAVVAGLIGPGALRRLRDHVGSPTGPR